MLTKIYFATWALYFAAAGGFLIADRMTPQAIVAFGFAAVVLTFMGMVNVLPTAVHGWLGRH